jgi:hypothetical protein
MADERVGRKLTTGQRRRLEITLALLCEEARAMVDLLHREGGGEPAAAQALAVLEEVLAAAESLAAELGLTLTRDPVSWKRRLQAWAALAWSEVLNCRPASLKGYGAVDNQIAELLTPRVEALAGKLMQLSTPAS